MTLQELLEGEMDEAENDAAMNALRAAAHPVRLRILSLLTGTAMSAAEVARELDLTHANASYHLRQLLDADELVVDGEEKIRGGLAKRYRYPHERRGANPNPRPTSADDQVFYVRAVGIEVERRIRERAPDTRNISSDLEGWVSPEIWDRACALLTEASMLLHDHNASPRTQGTIHVSATAWAFQMRQGQPDGGEQR